VASWHSVRREPALCSGEGVSCVQSTASQQHWPGYQHSSSDASRAEVRNASDCAGICRHVAARFAMLDSPERRVDSSTGSERREHLGPADRGRGSCRASSYFWRCPSPILADHARREGLERHTWKQRISSLWAAVPFIALFASCHWVDLHRYRNAGRVSSAIGLPWPRFFIRLANRSRTFASYEAGAHQ